MVAAGRIRLGIVVKNLTKPTFGSGADATELSRHVRAGVAFMPEAVGGHFVVTADADLTTTGTMGGDERHMAAGLEAWTPSRRVGLRGGVAMNTLGDSRATASGGLSVAFLRGAYLDGQLTGGSDAVRRGWSVGLRVTY